MRSRVRLVSLLFAVALGGASAHAADSRSFDVDHLQLAISGSDFLATEGAGRVRPWGWRVGAAYRFVDLPLVEELGKSEVALIASRSLLEVSGAIQLGRYVGLSASLPVLLDATGSMVAPGAALGDLRLQPRVEILSRRRFGLAALFGLRLPTGATDRFLGEGDVVFEPRLATEGYLGPNGMVRLGANLGVRLRDARQLMNLTIGDELFASLALDVVPRPWLDALVELQGASAMSGAFGEAAESPLEALIGVGGGARGVRVHAAVGFGLVSGWGAPRVRALVTVEYRRPEKLGAARPVMLARTPPRPILPPPLPSLPDIDDQVALPVVLEEPDVQFSPGRIELAHPIFFDKDRKRVHHRFFDELRQLARALARRTGIRQVWIEGHADATGPARWNLALSRRRAEAVAQFLIRSGVDPTRLHPVGFGEARPFIATPQGLPQPFNRCVHFYTEGSDQPPAPLEEPRVASLHEVRP